MDLKHPRALRVLRVLIPVTVLLIWGHSMVPADLSSQESSFLTELLNRFLSALGSPVLFSPSIVRKAAHFTEYAVLGAENAALRALSRGSRRDQEASGAPARFPQLFLLWVLVPAADECIQHFTPGRAMMWQDMLLDMCGYAFGVLAVSVFSHGDCPHGSTPVN